MRSVLFFIFSFTTSLSASLTLDRQINSDAVVVMNGNTGRILWAKNPDLQCYPASTTKIATVFYSLMQKPNSLKESVIAQKEALVAVTPYQKMRANYSKCPAYWLETDGSHVGIKPGEQMTYEDLLYATMLSSGNDACNVLSHHVAGSIPAFMDGLNRFVKSLGCKNTQFCNPHGLHHPEHVTTAKDMARIAQCAMYHPFFRKIVSTVQYERPATNKQPKTTYVQTNRLLRKGRYNYPYAVGIKTGYTSKAGYALIAGAEKDGRLIIIALLQSKDRAGTLQDAHTLFDACFRENLQKKTLVPKGEQAHFSRTFDGGSAPCATYTQEPLEISFYPSEEPNVRCLLVWDTIDLPVAQNAKVGEIRLIMDEKEVAVTPLFAKNEVQELFSARIKRYLAVIMNHWIIVVCAIVAAVFGILVLRRR
jgi:D-alanyl-D-alanine carboxypeptidase (penicillin-binding protein 5/6)